MTTRPEEIHRRQQPPSIGGHRHQHPLQHLCQIGDIAVGEQWFGGARRAQEKSITVLEEDQAKLINETRVGQNPRRRSISKSSHMGSRDDVDDYPIRRLPEAGLHNTLHREPLMV